MEERFLFMIGIAMIVLGTVLVCLDIFGDQSSWVGLTGILVVFAGMCPTIGGITGVGRLQEFEKESWR